MAFKRSSVRSRSAPPKIRNKTDIWQFMKGRYRPCRIKHRPRTMNSTQEWPMLWGGCGSIARARLLYSATKAAVLFCFQISATCERGLRLLWEDLPNKRMESTRRRRASPAEPSQLCEARLFSTWNRAGMSFVLHSQFATDGTKTSGALRQFQDSIWQSI
jgi:hypothetical protein